MALLNRDALVPKDRVIMSAEEKHGDLDVLHPLGAARLLVVMVNTCEVFYLDDH